MLTPTLATRARQHGDMVQAPHDMESEGDVSGSYDESGNWGLHGNHEAVAMDMAMLGYAGCAGLRAMRLCAHHVWPDAQLRRQRRRFARFEG